MPIADLDALAAYAVQVFILGFALGALSSIVRRAVAK